MLVVDDDEATRAVMRILVDLDRELAWLPPAAGGSAAIALARQHRPDIIICDVHMPGFNGLLVAARLRAMCPQAVLAMFTSDDTVGLLHPPHADAVFDKTAVDVDDMLRDLKRLCDIRLQTPCDEVRPDGAGPSPAVVGAPMSWLPKGREL